MLSPLIGGPIPRWSRCPVSATYSEGRSLPRRTATTFSEVTCRTVEATRRCAHAECKWRDLALWTRGEQPIRVLAGFHEQGGEAAGRDDRHRQHTRRTNAIALFPDHSLEGRPSDEEVPG